MKSHTTASFRQGFKQLSKELQKQAREAYRRFQTDPNYPSLRFKKFIRQTNLFGTYR